MALNCEHRLVDGEEPVTKAIKFSEPGGKLACPDRRDDMSCEQMSDENRTQSAWAAHCLEVLQTQDPSYRKNREVKGRFMRMFRWS